MIPTGYRKAQRDVLKPVVSPLVPYPMCLLGVEAVWLGEGTYGEHLAAEMTASIDEMAKKVVTGLDAFSDCFTSGLLQVADSYKGVFASICQNTE